MWKKLKARRRRNKIKQVLKDHAAEVIVGILMGLLTDLFTDLGESRLRKAMRRL